MMKPAGDETIHNILKGIIDKWRERGAAETAAACSEDESDMTETVILSPAGLVSPLRDRDECTETVVLSARGRIAEPPPFSPDLGSDAVLETVVLAATGVKTQTSVSPPLDEEELTMLETTILFPGMYLKGTSGENGAEAGAAGELNTGSGNGDVLSETVILPPRHTSLKAKRWKE